MPLAYFIGQFDIRDPEAHAAYRAQTPATIARQSKIGPSRIDLTRESCSNSIEESLMHVSSRSGLRRSGSKAAA